MLCGGVIDCHLVTDPVCSEGGHYCCICRQTDGQDGSTDRQREGGGELGGDRERERERERESHSFNGRLGMLEMFCS